MVFISPGFQRLQRRFLPPLTRGQQPAATVCFHNEDAHSLIYASKPKLCVVGTFAGKGQRPRTPDLDLDLNHCRQWWSFPFEVQRWPPDSRCRRQEAGSRLCRPAPLLRPASDLEGQPRRERPPERGHPGGSVVIPGGPAAAARPLALLLSGCWTSAHRGLAGAWVGLFGCPHPSRKGTLP